jgi:hypothetical protein
MKERENRIKLWESTRTMRTCLFWMRLDLILRSVFMPVLAVLVDRCRLDTVCATVFATAFYGIMTLDWVLAVFRCGECERLMGECRGRMGGKTDGT